MKEIIKQNQNGATEKSNDLAHRHAENEASETTLRDSGVFGAAPCSPDGITLSEHDLFCIDFLSQEGEVKESFQFTRSPVQDTSHLYLLLKRVLSSFGINGFTPRIRPGKFGGVQEGKFTVILGGGKHLEFENINL